jgi:4-amino-4-deoxy-L-arabinose transferase-like glycosyltransferase
LLLVLALTPRLIGLTWGLPDRSRYYSYHPDEPVLLWAIHQIRFAEGQLSPRFFNYGSLYLYLCRAAFDVADSAGWVESRHGTLALRQPLPLTPDEMAVWVDEFARLHWIGRLIAALMGALTAVATYALGRRLYSELAGRIAGVFMAVAPLHLVHSHFLAVDVPATSWVAVGLCVAAAALDRPRRPVWFLAGVLSGFAAGTKYNAGLVGLAALAALVLAVRRAPREKRRDQALDGGVYLVLGAALGFLISTPGVLIDTPKFRYDLAYERRHMAEGHGLVFLDTPPGWIYHLTSSLGGGLGWPATLLCLAGTGLALRRRSDADVVLLAFAVPYYLLIGAFQVKFARYTLPLYPVFAVWVGRVVEELAAASSRGVPATGQGPATVQAPATIQAPATEVAATTAQSPPSRAEDGVRAGGLRAVPAVTSVAGFGSRRAFGPALCTAAILALAWTALYAVALLGVLVSRDSRTDAATWVRKGPALDSVGLLQPPWFYTPPLSPAIGCVNLPANFMARFCRADRPPHLRVVAPSSAALLTTEELRTGAPEVVVVNEFEYGDALRLAEGGTPNEMAELWSQLRQNYREAVVLEHRPRLGPLTFFARSMPPHDLLYIMPTTRIFERR